MAETGVSATTAISAARDALNEKTAAEIAEEERQARIHEGRQQAAFLRTPGMQKRMLPPRRTRSSA